MKKLLLLAVCLGIAVFLNSQSVLEVKVIKLDNGLTVYLNEDHTQPNVFGAVAVKGGSKRDPQDATGIAHYFEHIMFKGTDKIGTIDYKTEKIYLDSISAMYDSLGMTKDAEKRKVIQLKINDLSIKASDYAIPNEIDKIIQSFGGTGLNAYTSYDEIVYFNQFPAEAIEKWIELYSHRFINPVFRLFQSELETVYEEKNMSMDSPFNKALETILKNMFPSSPYGTTPVIGNIDHLKNPSLRKMQEYYNTFYVANNMALILSGNFNSNEVIPFITEKFGKLKTGTVPPFPYPKEKPFDGKQVVKINTTPIPVGVIAFRTVPNGHQDELAIEVCSEILNNKSGTGLLDKLYHDNKIMTANLSNMQFNEEGAAMMLYIPKLARQSLKNAENIVMGEIERLKKGDFDDELFQSIKLNMKLDFETSLENYQSRMMLLIGVFTTNDSWDNVMSYSSKLDQLTKDDIVKIANKYFTDNRLVIYSKVGFPKKEKLDKPPYKHVDPKNSEVKSDYAKQIENMPEREVVPMFIQFGEKVKFEDITPFVHLYTSDNPMNTIFTLNFRFGIGTTAYPVLNQASQYLSLIGTENKDFEKFSKELQKLASTINAYASGDYFHISVMGFEKNLPQTLDLLNELITKMKGDQKQLEKFVREEKMGQRFFKADPSFLSDALEEYALYGNQSTYLTKLPIKQIKKLTSDSLLSAIKLALKYEVDIHYCGNHSIAEINKMLTEQLALNMVSIKSKSPYELEKQQYTENTVVLLSEKKAIQSQLNFNVQGEINDETERRFSSAFNNYFGSGMASIVFQEIREFRSLAYSAYGYYSTSFYKDKPGYFYGSMSTQADKTVEAITAFTHLLDSMPVKPDRTKEIQNLLLKSINSNIGNYRYLSYSVASWRKQGYPNDPRIKNYEAYKTLQFESIHSFYKHNILGKPHLITIVTDTKRVNPEVLKQFGKVIEVKQKDIYVK